MVCHQDESNAETTPHKHCRGENKNPLLSFLNPAAFDAFMPMRPIQIVKRMKAPSTEIGLKIDVKRCRKSALTCGHPVPIYCVLDDVTKGFDPEADFYYVSDVRNDILLLDQDGIMCVYWTVCLKPKKLT